MVKTAIDLRKLVGRFVELLSRDIVVDRVILSGDYAQGSETDDSDIWLLVISPSFEGMQWGQRSDLLALAGMKVDFLIQSGGFTPDELARTYKSEGGNIFLGMMLNQSREIYTNPAVSQTQEDRDD